MLFLKEIDLLLVKYYIEMLLPFTDIFLFLSCKYTCIEI